MKVWKEFVQKNNVLSPAWDRLQQTNQTSTPFALNFKVIDGLKEFKKNGPSPDYQLRVSLFDVTYKQFFGRTWIGDVVSPKPVAGQKPKLNYNQTVYLHTSLNDLSIIVLVEIVALTNQEDGSQATQSCGWGMFRLFKHDGDMSDVSDADTPPLKKLSVYDGSPRALLFLEDPIESNEFLKFVPGCQLSYTIETHRNLKKIYHLLPENVIVGSRDVVPGLADGQRESGKPGAGVDHFRRPRLLKPMRDCYLNKVTLSLNPTVDKFEEELCQLLNEDRINRDNKIADGTTVTVSERRLQVGIHNGWCYVEKPQVVHLTPDTGYTPIKRGASFKRTHSRTASSTSLKSLGSTLVLKNRIPLDGLVQDPMYSVVFLLEYVVSEPVNAEERKLTHSMARSQTLTLGVRWSAWSPFSSNCHSDVTAQLHGGPSPLPDEMFIYKLPVTDMVDEISAKSAAGNLSFSFVLAKKKKVPTATLR